MKQEDAPTFGLKTDSGGNKTSRTTRINVNEPAKPQATTEMRGNFEHSEVSGRVVQRVKQRSVQMTVIQQNIERIKK